VRSSPASGGAQEGSEDPLSDVEAVQAHVLARQFNRSCARPACSSLVTVHITICCG
jgi:hypothetical protein